MNKRIFAAASISSLGILACRPVLAIGWGEFLMLAAAVVLLIGPPLYRFVRRVEEFLKNRKRDQ